MDGTVLTARVAKLLAKSFFKDLASPCFDPGQIVETAFEIITLESNVGRYKGRTERKIK
jgi:hypothetical protein